MKSVKVGLSFLPLLAMSMAAGANAQPNVLPKPAEPFAGKIGTTTADSVPAFPEPAKAPAGAPNVLLVLTDDVGFAAASTFGGPIPTPNLDRLAARGLKYNRFHTTAMCSPTRAALLTGRNSHAVGTGIISDLATGYPGYWSILPKSAATIAEVLRLNGYSTAMFGKHHNLTGAETSPAGPFDRWPTGLGFDHFYGFLGGAMDQWRPNLYRDNSPAEQKFDKDPDYILDRDLADEALSWIHNQKAAAPDKPFFVYYATGSAHAPHQAPKEWIARFKGKFDQGWDKLREESLARQKALGIIPANTQLTPRPTEIPAWSSLTADQKRVSARLMEVFAAMLAYQDNQFGRLLDELDRMGESNNTLVIFMEGDNGGSAEGGLFGTTNDLGRLANGYKDSPEWLTGMIDKFGSRATQDHYPVGWAWATDTPFQWTKQVASHFGGTRNGMVISWPERIKAVGGIRSQFAHVTDIVPTIMEAVKLPMPDVVDGVKQQRVDGISLVYSFDDATAPSRKTTQYFELLANRAIYHDGWIANTTPRQIPWVSERPAGSPLDYKWELYDINHDFSQSRDLAAKYPKKLKEMQALFDQEARRNNVYPLDDQMGGARGITGRKSDRTKYVYWAKNISVPQSVAPPTVGRSFSVTADIVVPKGGADGILVATGSHLGGWSLNLEQGHPVMRYAFSPEPKDQVEIRGGAALPAGATQVRFDFNYDGGGFGKGADVVLSVGGQQVATGRVARTFSITSGYEEHFDIGRDTGIPVKEGAPAFDGEIRKVEVLLR